MSPRWLFLRISRTSASGVETDHQVSDYILYQNYPNPFNAGTAINYQLSAVSEQTTDHSPLITLKIYNLLGQEVNTLVHGIQSPGCYTITWDGRNSTGAPVPGGVYFYRLRVGSFCETKKMILLK